MAKPYRSRSPDQGTLQLGDSAEQVQLEEGERVPPATVGVSVAVAVLVVVTGMIGVSVPVVEIVHVVTVLDGLVATALTMDMLVVSLLVLLVLFCRRHLAVSIRAGRRFLQFAIYELERVPTPPPRSRCPLNATLVPGGAEATWGIGADQWREAATRTRQPQVDRSASRSRRYWS